VRSVSLRCNFPCSSSFKICAATNALESEAMRKIVPGPFGSPVLSFAAAVSHSLDSPSRRTRSVPDSIPFARYCATIASILHRAVAQLSAFATVERIATKTGNRELMPIGSG
jgi:hypothetical protein